MTGYTATISNNARLILLYFLAFEAISRHLFLYSSLIFLMKLKTKSPVNVNELGMIAHACNATELQQVLELPGLPSEFQPSMKLQKQNQQTKPKPPKDSNFNAIQFIYYIPKILWFFMITTIPIICSYIAFFFMSYVSFIKFIHKYLYFPTILKGDLSVLLAFLGTHC